MRSTAREVHAAVVLKGEATPKELTAHCADRLAAFKRPALVTILPEIPKGPTGKVQRRNLARAGGAVKVAVVGAGAIGAYVGAALVRGGSAGSVDRTRGSHLRALQEHGVTHTTTHAATSRRTLKPPATTWRGRSGRRCGIRRPESAQPTPIGAPRLGALLVGSQTAAIARAKRHPVLVFPGHGGMGSRSNWRPGNGGSRGKDCRGDRARERAIGCVVYCSTEIESPGVIRHIEGTRFTIGEPDGSISERCLRIQRGHLSRAA